MRKLGPILLVIGFLLTILAITMAIPAIVDLYYRNSDWRAFAASAFITFFIGIILILTNQNRERTMTIKQTFVLTTFSWVILAVFATLPFMFSDIRLSFTDAYFEVMSGLTTTGSTVIVGLDKAPPGILLWRALLQGLGGIGIIVLALAILPMLKIGGMQLFRTESSDKSDKILPRAKQISGAIIGTYILLAFACTLCLWLAGMTEFDAFCHALATISTGGFANYDQSIGYYNSPIIEIIITMFMILGSLPFVLYIQMMRGKKVILWHDTQVRLFLIILTLSITAITLWLYITKEMDFLQSLRHTSFNVTSIMTSTGFVSTDYNQWGGFSSVLIFMLTVAGGCTGSTTGGIKMFRFQILYETAKSQISQLVSPHGIFPVQYNGKPVSDSVKASVMSFFILFAFSFLILATLVSLTGVDYVTAMSASAAVLGNTGPGLGDIVGPAGTFAPLSDTAKWLLTFGMLLGRLELFTVLVLFSPFFWRD